MIPIKELREEIKNNVKWSQKRPKAMGGQSCGMPSYPVILTSEELELEITYGRHKSTLKNKQMAYLLFELVLEEEIK